MRGRPDYEELVRLEPRLADVEASARAVQDEGRHAWFCSNYAWLPVAAELRELVGVMRVPQPGEDPEGVLHDGGSYMTALEHLSPILPPCRGCGCTLFDPVREQQLDERRGG